MWTNFFSKIVLINLPSRPDRLMQSSIELQRHRIPYEVVDGIKNENGQKGICDTLLSLFEDAINKGYKNLLVLEDDVKVVVAPEEFERVMDIALVELPTTWEMLYLGANLPNPDMVFEFSAHLLLVKRALALHAVAYSRECMKMILSLPRQLPIDLQIANFIHQRGRAYATCPMLCVQREGFSDIEKKQTNYKGFIEDRYERVLNHLNLK